MLALGVVGEVKRLIDEGELSQRQIAKRLGVSRGTVAAIASGERGLYGRQERGVTDRRREEVWELPRGKCPGCGMRGYVPCVACQARAFRRHSRPLSGPVAERAHQRAPSWAA